MSRDSFLDPLHDFDSGSTHSQEQVILPLNISKPEEAFKNSNPPPVSSSDLSFDLVYSTRKNPSDLSLIPSSSDANSEPNQKLISTEQTSVTAEASFRNSNEYQNISNLLSQDLRIPDSSVRNSISSIKSSFELSTIQTNLHSSSSFPFLPPTNTSPKLLYQTSIPEIFENEPENQPKGGSFDKSMAIEVFTVLLIGIMGSVVSGYTFKSISTLRSFELAPGLFMLIPIMLNLKGNIEANLATRLATLANTGYLSVARRRNAEIKACLSIVIFQSFFLGFISSGMVSLLIPIISMDDKTPSPLSWGHQSFILIFTSLASATFGTILSGIIATATVLVCGKFQINSDNVSAPLVTSIGDLTTLLLISKFSTIAHNISFWLFFPFMTVFVLFGIFLYRNAANNPLASPYMTQGWISLIYAFLTSSISGALLEYYVPSYPLLTALSPIFNGSGQNVATIFASRLSTELHSGFVNPDTQIKTSFILLLSNFPVQLLFIAIAATTKLMNIFGLALFVFSLLYLAFSSLHVILLLAVGSISAKTAWNFDQDPDFVVNPIM
ncbi:hypothetical protein BB560_006609 [Smittium megazygosporum]|uniref:SLC41A/MgtE integral membrane domain-containing protein n=1 Tax=Smittium megazygosporum TaxID=133381 RepID=A0A2T9Y335_9FUNG|nr:hypothetical protein BB560_006609 [Smittium megazygosporum]